MSSTTGLESKHPSLDVQSKISELIVLLFVHVGTNGSQLRQDKFFLKKMRSIFEEIVRGTKSLYGHISLKVQNIEFVFDVSVVLTHSSKT